jgi:hypothetical protein
MEKHYCYGSGSSGCLYDYGPHFASTKEEVVDSFLFLFGDSLEEGEAEELRTDLMEHSYHKFRNPVQAGAYYCECSEQTGPCPAEED